MDPLLSDAYADAGDTFEIVSPAEIRRGSARARAAARWQGQITRARKSCGHFVEYGIRHERTNKPLKNGRHHWEWHAAVEQHPKTVIVAPVEHAKTQHLAIAKPLHLLGNNPELRGAIISNTEAQAVKSLGAITAHILENARVREVFPKLRPSKRRRDPWHTTAITVERTTIAKDPSLQALGVGGPIVGSRLDFVILDDVLDFENTRTPEQIAKLLDWFDTTLWTRLTEDAIVIVIGTPWAPTDLLATLAARPAFHSLVYSSVLNPEAPQHTWEPLWPEAFSRRRLIDIAGSMLPHHFARKYLCRVRTDVSGRFRTEWIERAKSAGRARTLLRVAPKTPGGRVLPCFTGIDLGFTDGEKKSETVGALSVLFTIAVDDRGRRIVVDVQSGHWQIDEIVSRMRDTHTRFGSVFVVESNGAQRWLTQWQGLGGMTVRPFFTSGSNKWDESFGIESIALELRQGLWVIPSGLTGQQIDPEVQAWINEMIFYAPNAHTGDRLMASWFARECAREMGLPMGALRDTLSR